MKNLFGQAGRAVRGKSSALASSPIVYIFRRGGFLLAVDSRMWPDLQVRERYYEKIDNAVQRIIVILQL